MTRLAPCPSCSRHVRLDESACPFCDAALSLDAAPARAIGSQRLGRAALFTFGAVALATNGTGCSTATQPDDAYHGSIFDAYGAPDVTFLYDGGHDGGLAGAYGGPPIDAGVDASTLDASSDAGLDAGAGENDSGAHAPYGAPPVPPPPPEEP